MSENKNGKRALAASKKDKNAKKANKANAHKAVATKAKANLQAPKEPQKELIKVDNKTKAQAQESANAVNKKKNTADIFLWILSFAILAFAIGGNYYYTQYIMVEESSLLRLGRVAIIIAIIAIGLLTLLFTTSGKSLINYGRDSYTELRKVVWPTRQEGLQTTFIVFIAVSIVSLFLYLCDLAFLQIVRVITI